MRIPSETEVYFSMEHASRYVDQCLHSADPIQVLEGVEFLKNVAIGSNKQKQAIGRQQALVSRFLQILETEAAVVSPDPDPHHEDLMCETTAALTSLSKGTEDQTRTLIATGVMPILLRAVLNPRTTARHMNLTLRALNSILMSRHAPHALIFEWPLPTSSSSSDESDGDCSPHSGLSSSESLVTKLLSLASTGSSFSNQEAVCGIFASSIQSDEERQRILANCGAVPLIADLLLSEADVVQVAALTLLSAVTLNNTEVSKLVVTTVPTACYATRPQTAFQTVPDLLTEMMSQERKREVQLLAAQSMTHLYRSEVLCAEDKRIVYKTLPTLIRCCKAQPPVGASLSSPDSDDLLLTCDIDEAAMRAKSADLLSFLIETDTQLQQIAATCDQVIGTIAELLKFHANICTVVPAASGPTGTLHDCCNSTAAASGVVGTEEENSSATSAAATTSACLTPAAARSLDQGIKVQNAMREAAFKVLAALAANDEEIRKRVLEMDGMVTSVMSGLTCSEEGLRFASLKCLHSLSRSVQSFRQQFPDQVTWPPIKSLLSCPSVPEEVTLLASSTLCNLLVEMSSSKAHFLDRKTLDALAGLTDRPEAGLRINGVWGLMNLVHKADQSVKLQILQTIGIQGIFRLLNDESEKVVEKTLGLLRNLLTTKSHIDQIMSLHGKDLIDALLMIIDSPAHSLDVKEQALCVLANIADGDVSKDLLMTNDEILSRLLSILHEGDEGISASVAAAAAAATQANTPAGGLSAPTTGGGNNCMNELSNSTSAGGATDLVKRPVTKLQVAVTYCITNLVWAGEEGCVERQTKLRDFGFVKALNALIESSDTDLFHKVKTALQQFPNKSTA